MSHKQILASDRFRKLKILSSSVEKKIQSSHRHGVWIAYEVCRLLVCDCFLFFLWIKIRNFNRSIIEYLLMTLATFSFSVFLNFAYLFLKFVLFQCWNFFGYRNIKQAYNFAMKNNFYCIYHCRLNCRTKYLQIMLKRNLSRKLQ